MFLFHTFFHIHNPLRFWYCSMLRAVTKLWHNKQHISITVIAHTTEEHVTFTVSSCNNRRAAGSGVARHSCTRQIALLQWNTWNHTTHINKGTVFSVRASSRLYHLTNQVESSQIESWQFCNIHQPVRTWTQELRKLQHWSHYQATAGEGTADREDVIHAVVNCRVCELALAL
jgi:hypothetical protein